MFWEWCNVVSIHSLKGQKNEILCSSYISFTTCWRWLTKPFHYIKSFFPYQHWMSLYWVSVLVKLKDIMLSIIMLNVVAPVKAVWLSYNGNIYIIIVYADWLTDWGTLRVWACFMLARVSTPSSMFRERERGRDRDKEREREKEKEGENEERLECRRAK